MWRPVEVWNCQTRSAASGVRKPSASSVGSTVRPHAASAPVSCTTMWASLVQMTPSQSRSIPARQMTLVLVPPMQNSTWASGWPHMSRMSWRACSQRASPSV